MLKTRERASWEIKEKILFAIASVLAFVSMVYLFWAQSIKLNGLYYSDFMGHISRALANGGSGYSLEGKLVVFFNQITNGSTIGISVFLALVVIATPVAVAFLLSQIDLTDKEYLKTGQKYWIGLWSIFAGPIVIPCIWNWFYKNAMNINAWHNSTSMEMRLFSVLALALYFRIQHYSFDQEKQIKLLDWLVFSLSLLISTWFKPSFFVGFAPVMLLWLMIDFFRSLKDGQKIRKIFIFGLAAIPAGCMAILQYMKLYGSREDVSLAISESQNVGLYLTRLGMFIIIPLLVFLFNRKKIQKDYREGNRSYYQVALLWAIEIMYHFFLTEVGRKGGNLGWGARIGNYLLLLFSLRLFCLNINHIWKKRKEGLVIQKYEMVYLIGVGFMFLWQLGDGIYYYGHLLSGGTYLI